MGWTAGDGGVEREGAQKLRTTGNITTNADNECRRGGICGFRVAVSLVMDETTYAKLIHESVQRRIAQLSQLK